MSRELQWRAVTTRDRRADGRFVYAVASTGIYCRPSCASRKPRREHVEFFAAPIAAETAGYRPCRRCRPAGVVTVAPEVERVRRVSEAVLAAPDAAWPLLRLARAAGSSIPQIRRAFRSVLGMSPTQYVSANRQRVFRRHLRARRSVTDATYEAGYGSPSRVYGVSSTPGMTPATYAKGGRGAHIDWLTERTPLGTVLVAATTRGLCFVEIGADEAVLHAELRREFPQADISLTPTPRLRHISSAVAALASARTLDEALPMDVRGTAFQWRVWRALSKIPVGETRSYSQVAKSIGAPSSVRAVARACATNPVSLVVPCHRVVGANGSLTGYRWGIDTKRALLAVEKRRREASART